MGSAVIDMFMEDIQRESKGKFGLRIWIKETISHKRTYYSHVMSMELRSRDNKVLASRRDEGNSDLDEGGKSIRWNWVKMISEEIGKIRFSSDRKEWYEDKEWYVMPIYKD